ncbi:MAG: RagB/SusD family nutrient uptake outer membrane protein [Odoribacteraceae bacterium]|jgi:hypothetical protein|nr:RagB/SusD family nutrient uptake outer membrane protein [Odoribacteraceae bacterium]
MKYNIRVALLVAVTVIALASCESYLDVDKYIYHKTTIDSVFSRKDRLVQYIHGTSAYLPQEDQLFTLSPFPFGLGSDECFASWEDDRHAAMFFMLDDESPLTPHFNNWSNFYKGIRKANLILQRIGECDELEDIERREYIGLVHFLRGYYYYSLLRQYGPVPILPDLPFDSDEEVATASIERATYDDCVEYICADMEIAASFLPSDRDMAFEYMPTLGAAMAVISRVRLHAASPWYNGNTRYEDWIRSDGAPFISPQEKPEKWAIAAVAAKRVIDLNVYELNTVARKATTLALPANVSAAAFPNGAGDIDPYLSYAGLFSGDVPSRSNNEYIYYYDTNPRGQDSPGDLSFPYNLGGMNGMNVVQDMVDVYRMRDGNPITASSAEYPYPSPANEGDAIGTGYTFSSIFQVSPNTARMHDNREPRFYATIGFNHCIWPGSSYIGTENIVNYEVTYYINGTGMPPANFQDDYNRTGVTCRKYINQEDNHRQENYLRQKWVPVFRYAEILLNYVEAMNEMGNSEAYTDEATGITVSRDVAEIVKYFNMIRYRGGIPGITEAEANNQANMRELIKLERRIEFAFEGHRYHDLRRWGEAYDAYNKKITGMDVSARSTERAKFYTRVILDNEQITKRIFSNKMYFFPIPQDVLNKNAKLVQNPGW